MSNCFLYSVHTKIGHPHARMANKLTFKWYVNNGYKDKVVNDKSSIVLKSMEQFSLEVIVSSKVLYYTHMGDEKLFGFLLKYLTHIKR